MQPQLLKSLNDMTAAERLDWAATRLEAFEATARLDRNGELVGELEGKPFRFNLNVVFAKVKEPTQSGKMQDCGFAGCAIGWLTATPELQAAAGETCRRAQVRFGEDSWLAFGDLVFFLHGKERSVASGLIGSSWEAAPFMPDTYLPQITDEQWTEVEENSEGRVSRFNGDASEVAHYITPSMVAKELRSRAAYLRSKASRNG